MNSSSPDRSLYELALSCENPPGLLKISPTVFKSMVELLLDMLIEHPISAGLWVKLPRGEVWQSEIRRYLETGQSTAPVYILKNQRDADSAESDRVASDSVGGEPLVIDSGLTALPLSCPVTQISLAADSRLRREYFVLVMAPQFSVLILAHRPRSVRNVYSVDESLLDSSISSAADDLERRPPLLGLCSFDVQIIHRVLNGINQAIAGQSGSPPSESCSEVAPGLANWDDVIQQTSNATLDPAMISQFVSHQIQRHEQTWYSNVTYRKQAEQASALQLENEELLNQLRLKNEFLKNVGQELRTPLANMKTALTLLNSPQLKPPQRQRYMDLLSQECDRQSSLITSVLDLIQLEDMDEPASIKPLRIVDVVPAVVSTYQPLAQDKGIALSYTISPDLPTVSCLSNWLRQVVINLLHNAIKFTPRGGKVWVRARQQGDYVQIEVRDTGSGIATTDIPKIFNRFYRVRHGKDDSSGAGLGLAIVQQLLLRCGGSISVNSRQGEGSAFNVMLPIYGKGN
ncbi:MAG: ATP-binding protein [Elainellaceae cyanobacterium]